MKNFELLKENEGWKEVVPFTFNEAQAAILKPPTTDENKDAKTEVLAEIKAASKIAVSEEAETLLNAEYQIQKLKINNLGPDYKLIHASFNEYEGKYSGVIYYSCNEMYHVHNFVPAVGE